MPKKISPIEEHKQDDLIKVRDKLIEIIDGEKSTAKDIVDASKLLARMHKALAPDKVTERTPQEKKKKEELSSTEKAEVDDLLKDES